MADDISNQEVDAELTDNGADFQAPYPGDKSMPQWDTGGLVDAPKFTLKKWIGMLGPGLILGGAAIGGGEWLVGPEVTAKYGGALLWLATLSIIGQVIYNIEISRYTLYCGEPIFTGKFRTKPGKKFWTVCYLFLDAGSIFPYLAMSAAVPLFAAFFAEVPRAEDGEAVVEVLGMTVTHGVLVRVFGLMIFGMALVPLVFGGKIHVALKWVMGFKIVTVMGFLLVLAVWKSSPATWVEIFSGFVKFGTVPVERPDEIDEETKTLIAASDWDGDGHADVIEPELKKQPGEENVYSLTVDVRPDDGEAAKTYEALRIVDEDADGRVTIELDEGGGLAAGQYLVRLNSNGGFVDVDGDGERDGFAVSNIFTSLLNGKGFPKIDWSLIAALSALVAISGSGGLSNTPVSNYTRDEGWGMGHHVGAIPSVVGGLEISLSHQGTVFNPDAPGAMPRWRRWFKHVMRDQLVVWMPACFIGIALPSMLSVEFLDRGTVVPDKWVAATMTADGVAEAVAGLEVQDNLSALSEVELAALEQERLDARSGGVGRTFWFLTIFCGFLVLAPSMSTSADGIIRRWVDVFWTTSDRMRSMPPDAIKIVYFRVLACYAVFGFVTLCLNKPDELLKYATTIYNYALGISCIHTVYVNRSLLPKQLQARGIIQMALCLFGLFFLFIAVMSTLRTFEFI
ncbi:MAG: Nramp family divalent metal transporter [Planctomycetota bacterium]|nr:Nramp family divalent metal transporter [Planctomycetota bacterium]